MKATSFAVAVLSFGFCSALQGSNLDAARQMEKSGDPSGARTLLARAAQNAPSDPVALAEFAGFLDRRGDPAAREAYRKLLPLLNDPGKKASVAKRLVVLDLLAGDRAAAERDLEAYRAAGGTDAALAPSPVEPPPAVIGGEITIPGPMRSFSRMAAISAEARPHEVLPALARNVVTNGYQASHSNDALEQTEYLKLVHRYLSQARELEKLAGPDKHIAIEECESPKAADLLRILGFRMRGGCGSDVVLETVNATRAFLTTDSGFPLPDLEQALRTNRPFRYDFSPSRVPVRFGAEYWLPAKDKEGAEFIDVFLSDPSLCRLYLGFSKLDPVTAEALRKASTMQRLKAYAHVLDFFGGMFQIRDGKAVVPGGEKSAAAWADLVGVSPDKGAAFFERLIARDDGWQASFFDALARMHGPVRDYLVESARLKRFYTAVRGRVTSPGPARPVFRSNADMMLLTTRLRLDASGRPHIPGGIEVWKNLFIKHPHGKYDGKLTKAASGWKEPDDVIEALFALCRKAVENEPLKIFMTLSDIDRNRATPLEPATVDRLARQYRFFGAQYALFNDAPSLSDKSILQFLDTADAINRIKDSTLRANAAGIMQGLVGIWRVMARDGSIPAAQTDASFSALLAPFAGMREKEALFDAGRSGVKAILQSASMNIDRPQERIIDLLVGSGSQAGQEAHTQLVQEMMRVLDAQRIVSLDTIFALADHLESLARGERLNVALINRLASRVSEIQLPRAPLSGVEKNAMAFGYWTDKHIESQRKLNLRSAIERASGNKEKLAELRGDLTPILRDTLVALNYAHYAPPGAQILFTNPLFVRSHDFLGIQGSNHTWRNTELFGTGWPSNGGGRLVGSLAGLAYALAEAEQNFLVPAQTQALIWGDLAPQMILSAKTPRWWRVTPAQMHWVALHLRYAQSLLAESALDDRLRARVLEALAAQAPPARTLEVGRLIEGGEVKAAVERVTPSELFVMARDLSAENVGGGPLMEEMKRLAAESPDEINYEAISRAFGTPKPTLANSYRPELLNLRTFPTLMGYSSRIMAESWESNTLYWAALADELYVPPAQLNVRIPEWTQKLLERIFASHLEDWPAVLRSLRWVGDDARAGLRAHAGEQKASLQ